MEGAALEAGLTCNPRAPTRTEKIIPKAPDGFSNNRLSASMTTLSTCGV